MMPETAYSKDTLFDRVFLPFLIRRNYFDIVMFNTDFSSIINYHSNPKI
ncbi:hypothetical protein ABIB50_003418 [Mucilaginibacter sp. UYCu711]